MFFRFSRACLVILTVLLADVASASDLPSRREALTAIAILENRFLSAEAVQAAQVVTQFVELSDDVLVVLDSEAIPWVSEGDSTDPNDPEAMLRSLLLAAYFAGNAKAQLISGKVEDMPYPGWLFVIRAYRSIQKKTEFNLPSIEELAAMEDKGTLERYARILKARQKSGPAKPAEII